jgi:hypothetical protein
MLMLLAAASGLAQGRAAAEASAAVADERPPETASAVAAQAPTPEPAPPAPAENARLSGFYLGAELGLGELHKSLPYDYATWGTSYSLAVSAGFAVTPRLLLFGELYGAHISNPVSNYQELTDFYLRGLGLGARQYLPANFFVSGSLLIARTNYYDSQGKYGLAGTGINVTENVKVARLSVGHEWKVLPSLSLALAGSALADTTFALKGLSVVTSASLSFPPADQRAPAAKNLAPASLYLDARLGVGGLWVSAGDTNGDSYTLAGMSLPLGLAAGVSLTRALVAFGTLDNVHVFRPAAERGTAELPPTYDQLLALDLYSAGLGLKYYLTPRGFFLSGSVSLSRLHYHGGFDAYAAGDTISETSHWGVTARLSAGKEWSVSPRWSVGFAGELLLGRMGLGYQAYSWVDPYTAKGLSLVFLTSFGGTAQREPASAGATNVLATRPADDHAHSGLFLNLSVGPGWTWVSNRHAPDQPTSSAFPDRSPPSFQKSGGGLPLALSAGYAFADRWVIFGELSELQARDPSATITSIDWRGFGPGLRYYLMPANVFVSGALLLSKVAVYDSRPADGLYGVNWASDWGLTGQASVGKEWRVASHLGVGLVAELAFGKMAGHGDALTGDDDYTVKKVSLLASVSLN